MRSIFTFLFTLAGCWLFCSANLQAADCQAQGNEKMGGCSLVHSGAYPPMTVDKAGSYLGNYGKVTVKKDIQAALNANTTSVVLEQGARLTLSGNTSSITVPAGATLVFSGNAKNIEVSGKAEVEGTVGRINVAKEGELVVRGVVGSITGSGKVTRAAGTLVGGRRV